MGKKEIAFRPMYGFNERPKPMVGNLTVIDIRDITIAKLRAKIEQLEAREAKRKAQTRERVRKVRPRPDRPKD